MRQVTIGDLGEFYWPANDSACLDHLQARYTDALTPLPFVKRFDVCIQAGGNVGVWPRLLATKFHTVYTFEPDPVNFNYLALNVPALNVVKLNAALGSGNRLITTVLPDHETDNIGAYQVEAGGYVPTFEIDQLALEACDLIILDIEGSELDAIHGGMDTIDRFKPVIHLEDKGLSEKYGHKKGAVIAYLESHGYKVVKTIARDFILCA